MEEAYTYEAIHSYEAIYSYSFMWFKSYKLQLSQLYMFYLVPVSRHQISRYGIDRNGHLLGSDEVQFNAWCHLFPDFLTKCHCSSALAIKTLWGSKFFSKKKQT